MRPHHLVLVVCACVTAFALPQVRVSVQTKVVKSSNPNVPYMTVPQQQQPKQQQQQQQQPLPNVAIAKPKSFFGKSIPQHVWDTAHDTPTHTHDVPTHTHDVPTHTSHSELPTHTSDFPTHTSDFQTHHSDVPIHTSDLPIPSDVPTPSGGPTPSVQRSVTATPSASAPPSFSSVPQFHGMSAEKVQAQVPFERLVCVGIPSARRFKSDGTDSPERYLPPLLSKLYEKTNISDVLVYLWNVDHSPSEHKEPKSLLGRFPTLQVVTSSFEPEDIDRRLPEMVLDSFEGVPVTKTKQIWRAKEVLDNAEILEKCLESGRPYTLFLEDDVFPTSSVWVKMRDFVKYVPHDYAFLTLYNPSVWEPEDKIINNGDEYAFFCCTQSLLFDNTRIGPIIETLRNGFVREPVDHLLVEYLHNTTSPYSKVYVAVPSLFQHMGAYSTLAERTLDPPEIAHQSMSWEALLQPTAAEITQNRSSSVENGNHFSTSFQP